MFRRTSTTFLLALLLPALGLAWLASEKEIALMVDGEPRTVTTHATTVGEALARAGVAVDPNDRVEPPVDTAAHDGMMVEVVHAREVVILVGGSEQRVIVTALTVDEVLDQLASEMEGRAARRQLVRPSRLARVSDGMVVEFRIPVPLTVVHDGQTREVVTDATTVAELLDRLQVALGVHDRVTPSADTALQSGMEIVVQRVELVRHPRSEPLPFDTVERRTEALPRGQRREVRPGRDGVLAYVEEVVIVDGVEEGRRRVEERIETEPVDRIVEVGTAQPAAPAAQPPPAAAPAEPAPPAVQNVQEGRASWYDHPDQDGFTAAHRSLPFGTVVTVTNLGNGRQVQVTINDRGPFVSGRIIDLNKPAFEALASASAGVIDVRIEW